MKKLLPLLLVIGMTACKPGDTLDLSGEWQLKLDPESKGITEQWFNKSLPETIKLPGSLAENGIGDAVTTNTKWTGDIVDSSWFKDPDMAAYRQPGNVKVPFWLQPDKYYAGMAWYRKKVIIPRKWNGKHIELFLERCHWESHVWVDGRDAGMSNSLGTPHQLDLSDWLTPGEHILTICVDNRVKEINVGVNSHSISDHTQSNWNGVTGRLELRCSPRIRIIHVSLYPDLAKKQVRVSIAIQNDAGPVEKIQIKAIARSLSSKGKAVSPMKTEQQILPGSNIISLYYPMGESVLLWDEFDPNLYSMEITLNAKKHGSDTRKITFGMRQLDTEGTRITINGRPVFLRGTLECAIFPNTGYPPTDTASWMRIFRIARAHGLNHLRFHSWCPPEAAFQAADISGFYLHVECSSWANQGATIGDGKPLDQYLYDESDRMVKAYGNHPSFCFMLYGNEPAGENQEEWLTEFITYWKKRDPRRLYSSGAGWPMLPVSDFNSTAYPRIQGWGEGLKSIINANPPSTDFDWRERIAGTDMPTVSHEIGQWCVFPDFKEISQYTGVLKPRNFEIFRESLSNHHLAQLADSFVLASGKLQALCYKADIEAALRTPGFGGFQLLDLHDFPGQGTALVGVLNPFWNEKGYIKAEEYRAFCNSTVPLMRLPKMVFTNADTLKAVAEIAHFGPKPLKDVTPSWKITDKSGKVIFGGSLPKTDIPIGNAFSLGNISVPLGSLSEPQMLRLTLEAGGFINAWSVWVYPAQLPKNDANILISRKIDAKAREVLSKGGKVLLIPVMGSLKPEFGGNIAAGFSSIFWNTAWTGGQAPHTLGILCNPSHPALQEFPTEFHSNWQWWDAMSHANAVDLSTLPDSLHPIVRIIDDWFTNRPLALVFEVNTGKGKLIVCSADLLTNADSRPEARQLLLSLTKYMESDNFNPGVNVDIEQVRGMFK
jgi:hypothetical protein